MSTRPLPKWAMLHYAKLWRKFKDREFTFEQASKTLKLDENLISVTLSYFKKFGWLAIYLHPTDSRKRIYKLTRPEVAVKDMFAD